MTDRAQAEDVTQSRASVPLRQPASKELTLKPWGACPRASAPGPLPGTSRGCAGPRWENADRQGRWRGRCEAVAGAQDGGWYRTEGGRPRAGPARPSRADPSGPAPHGCRRGFPIPRGPLKTRERLRAAVQREHPALAESGGRPNAAALLPLESPNPMPPATWAPLGQELPQKGTKKTGPTPP